MGMGLEPFDGAKLLSRYRGVAFFKFCGILKMYLNSTHFGSKSSKEV